jgi:hypothetical protein
MSDYTKATEKGLAQLLREAQATYDAYKQKARRGGPVREWPEWCAAHLLESGKLANLFLTPSEESLHEESTEAG